MKISRELPPERPGEPGFELYEFAARHWDEVLHELQGNDDLGTSALRSWAQTTRPDIICQRLIVARQGGEILGLATADLPQLDNTHTAHLDVIVAPSHRRRGIGSALLAELEAASAEDGRQTLQAWTWDALLEPRPGLLAARDGDGVVDPAAPGAAFLLTHGFKLVQVDLMSGLTLPPQEILEEAAAGARAATPAEYRLIQWRGDTPERWLDDMARLQMAMSTDAPAGEAELEPELVDAARIVAGDSMRRLGGLDNIVTVVEHGGALVGFTRMVHDAARPEVGDQWDTLVVQEHRGHGLGLLLKTASHAALRGLWPELNRLVTGNASENRWMLGVNQRLGYRPIAASGWYERRGSGSGAE